MEKNLKSKLDQHSRTIDKVKIKCQNQFDVQDKNYTKFEEIVETRLQENSKKVLNKYNSQ